MAPRDKTEMYSTNGSLLSKMYATFHDRKTVVAPMAVAVICAGGDEGSTKEETLCYNISAKKYKYTYLLAEFWNELE